MAFSSKSEQSIFWRFKYQISNDLYQSIRM